MKFRNLTFQIRNQNQQDPGRWLLIALYQHASGKTFSINNIGLFYFYRILEGYTPSNSPYQTVQHMIWGHMLLTIWYGPYHIDWIHRECETLFWKNYGMQHIIWRISFSSIVHFQYTLIPYFFSFLGRTCIVNWSTAYIIRIYNNPVFVPVIDDDQSGRPTMLDSDAAFIFDFLPKELKSFVVPPSFHPKTINGFLEMSYERKQCWDKVV